MPSEVSWLLVSGRVTGVGSISVLVIAVAFVGLEIVVHGRQLPGVVIRVVARAIVAHRRREIQLRHATEGVVRPAVVGNRGRVVRVGQVGQSANADRTCSRSPPPGCVDPPSSPCSDQCRELARRVVGEVHAFLGNRVSASDARLVHPCQSTQVVDTCTHSSGRPRIPTRVNLPPAAPSGCPARRTSDSV